MAGFDITSLLNQLMGKQQQAHATGAAPSGGGGLGNLLNSGMVQKLAPMIGGLVAGGGLSKLMESLKGAGAGDQAKSWVSSDQPNQPVSDEQITRALGHEQISQVANTLGMTHEEAAHTMAQTLPHVVDAMTPEGQLPQPAAAGSGAGAPGADQPGTSQAQNRPQAGGTAGGRPQGR